MVTISDITQGIVVETTALDLTGQFFYSDATYTNYGMSGHPWCTYDIQPLLNELSRIYVIGIGAGIIRMALAVIHIAGHVLAACVTWNSGHLYHAAKGGCEFLRGFIEAIPFAGRCFAKEYVKNGDWWIIKIYNPNQPDGLDQSKQLWQGLKQARPTAYIQA